MNAILGTRLVHPTQVDLYGNPILVAGKAHNALRLDGNRQYVDAGISSDKCLGDLSRCPHGFTFSTWAKFDKLDENNYFLSTGNKGVKMFYENGMLHTTFNQPGKEWRTSVRGVQPGKWYFIEATWHPERGAKMYFDNKIVSYTTGPTSVPLKPDRGQDHFFIGRANPGDTNNFKYPSATFDEMEMWYLNRDDLLAFDYIQRGKYTYNPFELY